MEDAEGNKTFTVRDDRRRIVTTASSAGVVTNFVYDAANRLVKRVDPSDETAYTYDNAGRLLTVEAGHEPCPLAGSSVVAEYVYDASPTCPGGGMTCSNQNGKLAYVRNRMACTGVSSPATVEHYTHYGYDDAGRIVEEYVGTSAGAGARQVHVWDKNGNLLESNTPTGSTLGTVWGSVSDNSSTDRPSSLTYKASGGTGTYVSNIGWLPGGILKSYTQANSIGGSNYEVLFDYNLAGRISQVKHALKSGKPKLTLNITENARGLPIARDFSNAYAGTQDQHLAWDWQGRLRCDTAAAVGSCPTSGATLRTNVSGIDGAGNRTSYVHQNTAYGLQNATVTYGAGEQVSNIAVGGDTIAYSYDVRGHRKYEDNNNSAYDRREYTYDWDGRLATISGKYYAGGAWQDYVQTNFYDHRGRRVLKSYLNVTSSAESQTQYFYDANDRLIQVVYTANVAAPSTYAVYDYLWLGQRVAATIHWSYTGGTSSYARYFAHSDDRNEIIEMSSWPSSGNATIVWAQNPDASGWREELLAGVFQPFALPGWLTEAGTDSFKTSSVRNRPALMARSTYGVAIDPFGGDLIGRPPRVMGQQHGDEDLSGGYPTWGHGGGSIDGGGSGWRPDLDPDVDPCSPLGVFLGLCHGGDQPPPPDDGGSGPSCDEMQGDMEDECRRTNTLSCPLRPNSPSLSSPGMSISSLASSPTSSGTTSSLSNPMVVFIDGNMPPKCKKIISASCLKQRLE